VPKLSDYSLEKLKAATIVVILYYAVITNDKKTRNKLKQTINILATALLLL
jgi:uncharacterized membrane protein